MTHVDLFSGIGGFALAAHANGIRTVQFCEIDSRCRDFLSQAWPGVSIHDDIRTFHWGVADANRKEHRQYTSEQSRQCNNTGLDSRYVKKGIRAERAPFLLTAGVPCQPASRAGKQRGEADDRWLWPEAIRVLRETSPAWCLFENPPGIGDLEFDRILADVEAEGYEVEVLSIPACAVNAPHRRERYWIVGKHVANTEGNRPGGTGKHEMSKFYRRDQIRISTTRTSQGDLAHADEPRREGPDVREGRHDAHGLCAERAQGDLADTGRLESGQDEQKRGSQGRTTNRRDSAECVGYAESNIGQAGENKGEYKWHDRSELSNAGSWNHFVWLPCADGKVRRAPDDTFGLVDGLHRSLLSALGNSIVPQVAAQVIAAMVKCDHIGDANEMVREG